MKKEDEEKKTIEKEKAAPSEDAPIEKKKTGMFGGSFGISGLKDSANSMKGKANSMKDSFKSMKDKASAENVQALAI